MEEKRDSAALEESTRRWTVARVVLLFLFVAAFPFYRIYEPAQRADAREDLAGFLADHGAELFETDCAACHGIGGRGGIGPAIGSANFLQIADDDQIAQLIAVGVPGTQMVAYSLDYGGPMSSQEIEAITAYLRSLEEDAESNPNWQTPLADEDFSGQELFALACSQCHGIDRAGIEDVAPSLASDSFALEENDEWLAARISEGQNEMPRFGRVLTDTQIASIIAFLRGVPFPPQTTTTLPGATTSTTLQPDDGVDDGLLELGMDIFQVGVGNQACAECHGTDGAGTQEGPNIIGSSKSAISGALGGGVPDMGDIKLTSEQLEAVYQYLRTLSG